MATQITKLMVARAKLRATPYDIRGQAGLILRVLPTGKRIWYVTLRDKIHSTTNFQGAADLTYATAGQLYGQGSLEQQAVVKGWAGVGIQVNVTSSPPPVDNPPANPGCLSTVLKMLTRR